MQIRVTVGLGAMALVLAPGCGDSASGGPAPLESASLCTAAWQPLTPAGPYDTSSSLAYRDGVIYYARYSTRAIESLPVTGGTETPVATDVYTRELWVDGDHLLYPGGALGNQFFSVPVAGGTPVQVLDGTAGRTDLGAGLAYALTPTEIFWTEESKAAPTTAWRGPRAGGAATFIGSATATIPTGDTLPFSDMAVAPDAVVMATILGVAAAVPLDGSPARTLATSDTLISGYGNLAGIDGAGPYWSVPRAGAPDADDTWSVVLAPQDGSALHTFWEGTPPHAGVEHMWPYGNGGWVAIVDQLFDDMKFHISVWLIDATGMGRRLACEPTTGAQHAHVDTRPAIAPDAIYLVDDGSKFQIVRVPR